MPKILPDKLDRAGYSGRGIRQKIVVHQRIASLLLGKFTGLKHPRNPAPHSCIAPAVSVPRWARCRWLTACRGYESRRGPGWKTAPYLVGPETSPVFIANNDLFSLGIGAFSLKTCLKRPKGRWPAGSCAWYGDKGAGHRCRLVDCRRFPNSQNINQFLAFVGESIHEGLDGGRSERCAGMIMGQREQTEARTQRRRRRPHKRPRQGDGMARTRPALRDCRLGVENGCRGTEATTRRARLEGR